MTRAWRTTTLGACCEIVSGATPRTGEPQFWDGEIPWATPKDLSGLGGKFIATTERQITQAGLESCAASVLPARSVLFSSRAPIGHVAINTLPMATNQGFKSFVPKPGEVDPDFLYHWLRAQRPYLESLGNGATFKEVSKAVVSRVEIALPAFDEQRRIAGILDKADAIRRKRDEAIALAQALLRSAFLETFGDPVTNPRGWPLVPLGQLIADGDSINYGVVQPGPDVADGVPLVRVGDFADMAINGDGLKRISREIEANYARSRLRGDEVLVACVGSIGKVALVDERLVGANIARAVARVRPGALLTRTYLASFLATPFAQRHFSVETRTVSQPTLNITQIQETPILVPPRSAQDAFGVIETRIRALSQRQRDGLDSAATLFNSLVTRAFSGLLGTAC